MSTQHELNTVEIILTMLFVDMLVVGSVVLTDGPYDLSGRLDAVLSVGLPTEAPVVAAYEADDDMGLANEPGEAFVATEEDDTVLTENEVDELPVETDGVDAADELPEPDADVDMVIDGLRDVCVDGEGVVTAETDDAVDELPRPDTDVDTVAGLREVCAEGVVDMTVWVSVDTDCDITPKEETEA